MVNSLVLTLRMIKWEHTVFALPFAVLSLLVATAGRPEGWVLFWVLVAMVGARSTAMAFNRLVDADIDARNPRTAAREIPAGKLARGPVMLFTAVTGALLVLAAWQLNPLCLALSPVALGIVYVYSLTKRFTPLSHLVLGLGLAVAPIGAWLAAQGSFHAFPLWLGAAVLCWVGGFDIIYACQDTSFDRRTGLHSMSAWLGDRRALLVARGLHVLAVIAWLLSSRSVELGLVYQGGVVAVAGLLIYEHWLVRDGDLRQIDRAFFQINSYVGLVLFGFGVIDIYLV